MRLNVQSPYVTAHKASARLERGPGVENRQPGRKPDKATFIAGQGPALLGKALSLACFLMAAHAALAQTLPDETLARIRFEQKLDGQVSLDLPFRDEDGRPVRLRQYFGEKPVVLVLGYYQCPMLCTLVLNGMVESAADMKWSIGREFEVLDVSINPEETPALAAAKKRSYVKRYGRSEAAQGWHFLTGNQAAIQQLANEVGFHYAYDPASKQFAHPSGLVILTPQGKVSGYLFGVTFAPKDLYTGLRTATRNQVGSPIQELLLLCFHYNPITGKYSKSVIVVLRVLSAATILGFLGLVVALARRGKGPGTTWQGNDSEPATPAARTQPGTRT